MASNEGISMAAGMFGRTQRPIKSFQGKREGERESEKKMLPCYPSFTFFCPRWSCLGAPRTRFPIGWRSHGSEKRSGSFGEHKRQLLLSRHYDLRLLWSNSPTDAYSRRHVWIGYWKECRDSEQGLRWVGGLGKKAWQQAKNWKQSVGTCRTCGLPSTL